MNNELSTQEAPISLQDSNGVPMANSRIVAMHFGKQHKDVLKAIRNLVSQEELAGRKIAPISDSPSFVESSYKDSMNRQKPFFLLDRDAFSLLVMGFTGQDAYMWKCKYIAAFNAMEKALREQSPALPNFDDPVAAARAWADAKEQAQIAEQKNLLLEQKTEEQAETIKKAEPKIEGYDALMNTDNCVCISDMCREIGILNPIKVFFPILRLKGLLTQKNLASCKSLKHGWLVNREREYGPKQHRKIKPQAMVPRSQFDKWRLFAKRENITMVPTSLFSDLQDNQL